MPVHPSWQIHSYPLILSTHFPFTHGSEAHSSMSKRKIKYKIIYCLYRQQRIVARKQKMLYYIYSKKNLMFSLKIVLCSLLLLLRVRYNRHFLGRSFFKISPNRWIYLRKNIRILILDTIRKNLLALCKGNITEESV